MVVDSLLNEKAFKVMNFFDGKNDSLVSGIEHLGDTLLMEKYIPKVKNDPSYPDTTIFYYSNEIQNLAYSSSEKLEKEKQMKIIKVRMIFDAYFEKQIGLQVSHREYVFELKK